MSSIDRSRIENAVIQMFKVNMGVKPGEKILVLSDIPTRREWKDKNQSEISKMVSETLLGKTVAEIARDSFPACQVDFYPYFSLGRSGVEPPDGMAQTARKYHVIVAINSFSLTHTEAREGASKAGARVATMRGAIPEMFYPEGSISVDYLEVERETKFIASFLTRAREAKVISDSGTNLRLSLKGRKGGEDTGIYVKAGKWGNLPAGEAYIAPVEGTAEGELVIEKGWFPNLVEEMTMIFRRGEVQQIRGGGEVNRMLSQILGLESQKKRKRCNLAELGIGTNPKARRTDITIEAEKIKGTIHVGIGDNSHMGGKVVADYHQDFVVPKPDLFLDGEKMLDQGKWIKA
jgi:leucyl aminopeptidase (aminopeptidase T)